MPWLTDERKEHILRTAQTVKELSDRFKIQADAADNAYIAAVYHDCAKGIEKELLKKYSKEIKGFEEYMPTLHAPLGACIARDIFGIENESILEAIRWHCTGKARMTKAELLALTPADFDFEKQTVRISRQLVGNLKLKEKEFTVTEYAVIERNPKTENSYRILRVPKVVMQEVKRRQQLIELRKTDPGIEYKNFDYVCCQENGEPRSLTAMNQALTKICNRNGLANITVHGLRHMFATILIELGVPLFKISGLLGHSSVHTTYEYYCEIMDEQDKIIAFVNNTFVPQQTGTEG